MRNYSFAGTFAILLIITLVASSTFFITPQRTHAQGAAIGCMIGQLSGFISGGVTTVIGGLGVPVMDSFNLAQNSTSAGATLGDCIDTTILKPLARSIARMLLQQVTASTINWITGRNGTGQPSFVTNLSMHLQSVGDSSALSFIAQTSTAFNSPFGSAISMALQTSYFQQTSLGGFWAANKSTLPGTLQSQQAFLSGDWSQGGGLPTWFALTGPNPNNPYILYENALSQVGSNVSQAVTNRRQDLIQGSGFLSWCGGNTTSTSGSCVAVNGACPAGCVSDDTAATGCSGTSISPQAPCTNPDGSPAQAQTPGSVINGYTQKIVVGAGIDQLVSAQDLDSALGAIVNVLINQVLGGAGGLFGASTPSSGRPAVTTQLQNYSSSNTSAATSATSIAQSALSNVTTYTNTWNSIVSAANTASTTLTSLADFCIAKKNDPQTAVVFTDDAQGLANFISASTAQAAAARSAITTEITPVLIEAQAALSAVAGTKAFALKVETEAIAATAVTTTDTATTLNADVQTLMAMPPSSIDIINVQSSATVTGRAVASPAGSVTVSNAVSNGTRMDQMKLITTNAAALKTSVCTPGSSTSTSAPDISGQDGGV